MRWLMVEVGEIFYSRLLIFCHGEVLEREGERERGRERERESGRQGELGVTESGSQSEV